MSCARGVRPAGRRRRTPRIAPGSTISRAKRRVSSPRPRADIDQTRPTTPPPPPGAQVELTLDEATTRALERNLELAVERLNPQTFDLNIARIRAAYRPTATSHLRPARRRAAADQPVERRQHRPERHDDLQRGHRAAGAVGRRQLRVPVQQQQAGHVEQLRELQPDVQHRTSTSTLTPAAAARVPDRQQPPAAARHRASTATSRRSSCAARSRRRSPTCATRTGSCVYALEARGRRARLARRWPRSSSRTTGRASKSARWRRSTSCRRRPKRRRGGRRWRRPKRTWRTAELALKRLIVNGTDDPLWRAAINPVDRPTFAPEPLDVEGAVRKALDNRTDLEQRAQDRSTATTSR